MMMRIVARDNERVLIIPNSVYLNPSNSRGLRPDETNFMFLNLSNSIGLKNRGANSTPQEEKGNGLKGQQAYSPGQRPGYGNDPVMVAPQGQKPLSTNNAFALYLPLVGEPSGSGRNNRNALISQGVALGWWLLAVTSRWSVSPFGVQADGMPQRDRLIELNKIAIQQMKVLEGVEERRMLK